MDRMAKTQTEKRKRNNAKIKEYLLSKKAEESKTEEESDERAKVISRRGSDFLLKIKGEKRVCEMGALHVKALFPE